MKQVPIRIENPCHEDWAAMSEVERGRFCCACDKVVHDLSTMTVHEAKALLIRSKEERICIRVTADASGRIRFRNAASTESAPNEPGACPSDGGDRG